MPGVWKHPRHRGKWEFANPESWERLAPILERGRFDALFLADILAPYDQYEGSANAAIRYGVQFPVHDPSVLVPIVARVTRHLGIGLTVSTSFDHPYQMARRLSSLDHITGGRLAWNVVTSFQSSAFQAMGEEALVPANERYERANEYVELCYKLWDSWEPDAVITDQGRDTYIDPARVQVVEHAGKFFRMKGTSMVAPSPQRRPVIWQAGSSAPGRDFAAKHAEAVFCHQANIQSIGEYAKDVRDRAADHGRNPERLRIFNACEVIVAATTREAEEVRESLAAHVSVEGALALLSGHIGFDLAQLDLDTPIAEVDGTGVRAALDRILDASQDFKVRTWRDAAQWYALSSGAGPVIVGNPTEVTDQIEALVDETGIDGLMLSPTYLPESLAEFVDLVVPELQRRGRARLEYGAGTLRDTLLESSASGR